MDKEKQIEEMARIICGDYNGGVCALDGSACNYNCEWRKIAKHLYNAGYRKASEVAREIFEEIKRTLDTAIWSCDLEIKTNRAIGFNSDAQRFELRKKAIEDAKDHLRIVEKKYTESEKDNG